MNINKLIKQLEALRDEHGQMQDVVIADTGKGKDLEVIGVQFNYPHVVATTHAVWLRVI